MIFNLTLYSLLAFIFSYLFIYFFKKKLADYFLQKPNSRSSHIIPKPSGGGISFVLSFGLFSTILGNKLPLLCLPLAALGFLDDLFDINRRLRYLVQVLTAILIIFNSHFFKNYLLEIDLILAILIFVLMIIFVTSIINFINFMDGIDGLVCSSLIIILIPASILISPYLILLVSALLGFLLWNWYPSKVFMGDIGSTFLGAILAGTLIQVNSLENFFRIIIIASPLLLDASICLIRRFFANENIFNSHCLHLYQRLYKSGWSHSKVTICYLIPTLIIAILSIVGNLTLLYSSLLCLIIFGIYLDYNYSIPFKKFIGNRKK